MEDEPVIYLDNHATTRTDPRVVEAMLPVFEKHYGNPGSATHRMGNDAANLVYSSRSRIAKFIGARPNEIVFTNGATESNNLAIRGISAGFPNGGHLVVVQTEHKAVLAPVKRLESAGFSASRIGVCPNGQANAGEILLDDFKSALRDDTRLVSVMLANSEIGVIQPLAEICKICRERNILVHTDATQAVGKIPVNVNELDVDLLSFSSHKLYGPRAMGVLYVRQTGRELELEPLIDGGGQENGRRSGTLNVPGIVGLARALEICDEEMQSEATRVARLRSMLYEQLSDEIGEVPLNGPTFSGSQMERRLAGNLNVQFPGLNAAALMMSTPGIAVSGGSACTSGDSNPSHVLVALGLDELQIESSVRFGLGRFTTESEITQAVSQLAKSVQRLKKLGS